MQWQRIPARLLLVLLLLLLICVTVVGCNIKPQLQLQLRSGPQTHKQTRIVARLNAYVAIVASGMLQLYACVSHY